MSARKRGPADFALLGGPPAFDSPLRVEQHHLPEPARYEAVLRELLSGGWYTNHGPRAQEVEARLAEFFGVRHAVVVANHSIGLVMTLKALGCEGRAIVPALAPVATVQSLAWAGLEPLPCDVSAPTAALTASAVSESLGDQVSVVVAVNPLGGACDVLGLEAMAAARGAALVFDSGEAAGCTLAGRPLAGFGDAEIFSLAAGDVLSATEGGCVCTDDDELAARLRNIRSSYGAGRVVPVPLTSNGRFSEAQAAFALMSLEDFEPNRAHDARLHERYRDALGAIPGLAVRTPVGVASSNYQTVALEIDEACFGMSRDRLLAVMRGENVLATATRHAEARKVPPFARRVHDELPVAAALAGSLVQLPNGPQVSESVVDQLASLLQATHHAAPALVGAAPGLKSGGQRFVSASGSPTRRHDRAPATGGGRRQ